MTRRTAALLCAVVVAGLLLHQLVVYARIASAAVQYPYGLDYGEGIVWQQAILLNSSLAYGDINAYPAIVFHYTPVYHAVARVLAGLFDADLLATGRALTIGSTMLLAAMVAVATDCLRGEEDTVLSRVVAAATSALLLLCIGPIVFWSVLMRVDMLAHLFSFAGIVAGIYTFRHRGLLYVAATCFLFAVFTKQNSIAAPLAWFSVAMITQRRLALRALGVCVGVGSAVVMWLSLATHGGFIRHVLTYNINRINWTQGDKILEVALPASPLILATVLVLLQAARSPAQARRETRLWRKVITDTASSNGTARLVIVTYLFTTTVSLIGILKSGAGTYYTIEWLLLLCVFGGDGMRSLGRVLACADTRPVSIAFSVQTLLVPILIAKQVSLAAGFNIKDATSDARAQQLGTLVAAIKASARPVVSDDMVLVLRSGKTVELEPAIFAELASVGRWDERRYVRRILNRDFAMFITEGDVGGALFESRYDSAVRAALARAYPAREHIAGLTLHRPAP